MRNFQVTISELKISVTDSPAEVVSGNAGDKNVFRYRAKSLSLASVLDLADMPFRSSRDRKAEQSNHKPDHQAEYVTENEAHDGTRNREQKQAEEPWPIPLNLLVNLRPRKRIGDVNRVAQLKLNVTRETAAGRAGLPLVRRQAR